MIAFAACALCVWRTHNKLSSVAASRQLTLTRPADSAPHGLDRMTSLRALTAELRIDKDLDLSGCSSLRTLKLTLHKVIWL